MPAFDPNLNRKERRALKKQQSAHVSSFPRQFVEMNPDEFPYSEIMPVRVWRNREFLAMLYKEDNPDYPGLLRLSICRSRMDSTGHWQEGIGWEELQNIKLQLGFGAKYAIEIYPCELDLVNVANMRHLWLLDKPLRIGWFK